MDNSLLICKFIYPENSFFGSKILWSYISSSNKSFIYLGMKITNLDYILYVYERSKDDKAFKLSTFSYEKHFK